MAYRLLVIESDEAPADASVCAALGDQRDYSCRSVTWESVGPPKLMPGDAHAVVAVAVPRTSKSDSVFQWLHDNPPTVPTFAVLPGQAGEPLLRAAVEAVDDFILAPIRVEELRHRLGRLLGASADELDALRQRLLQEIGLTQLVGRDPVFVRAIEHVPRFARSDVPVLITGETGTGKELCARAIHHLGKRRDFPFIAVDCSAIPEHLFENELFGHVRGAFTDAHRDQRGLVSLAERGTLFLDEIDAMSLPCQAKLLRFLQEHTFRPLGAERFHTADVNVIAATNRDIEAVVRAQQFRADLYFRLNVLRLHLPPLRERVGDILLLATHFLDELRRPDDPMRKRFSPAALRKLEAHRWPGNVREFFNVVQRAVVLSEGAQISPAQIEVLDTPADRDGPIATFRSARSSAVAAFEKRYVEQLLAHHNGNVTRAAREAGKDRRAFGRLVKKYSLKAGS